MVSLKTADLCDVHADRLQIAEPLLANYGGQWTFSGPIATVKCFEDNSRVRDALESAGNGRVLVVDGGASMRCALLGDRLASAATDHGWTGILVNGCIRDSIEIGRMRLGVRALATFPLRSVKRDSGESEVRVRFAGVTFVPGHYLYADADGILVAETPLLGEGGPT